MEKGIKHIVLIGSGNLATALGKALFRAGFTIEQVYSKTEAHAKELADMLNAHYTTQPDEVKKNAGCYIVAVPDSEILSVISTIDFGDAIVVHTSGSTSISVFEGRVKNYGIFYPLQTFSKNREVDFSIIPVYLEACSTVVLEHLQQLANTISNKVLVVNSQQRLRLHIASVFACNFVNRLLAVSADLQEASGLLFSDLHGLITETVQKALTVDNPATVQTGPAIRQDEVTIQKHLEVLASQPELQAIYRLISDNIKHSI